MLIEDKKFLKNIAKEEKSFLKASVYLYGTEAIGSYYNVLNLKGKDVLTINGSGDQVLNAFFFGANKVTGFDLVKNTRHILNLKIVAIKKLKHKEFLSFFGNKNKIGNFDYNVYCSIRDQLGEATKIFFNELFKQFNNDGEKMMDSDNFRKRAEFYIQMDKINPFLSSAKNYLKLRKILLSKSPIFIESNLYEVHNKIKEKFDVINLSNVLNYVSGQLVMDHDPKPLESINNKILLNLKSMLKKHGKIIFYRFYRSPERIETMPLINRASSIEWLINKNDFRVSQIKFEGILQGEDAITILEYI